jgi:L-fuculose-phosphate aldolase
MAKTLEELRREMVEIGRLLHQRGFVAANDGNITARVDSERVLSTPTMTSKGMMEPDDLCLVDYEGRQLSGRETVTSEIAMHLMVYSHRPDVNAITHAHPPTATGYATAGLPLNKALLPEVVVSLGEIPLARYGTPGTLELSQALEPLVGSHDAILMSNHGVVTFGADLWRAYFMMERVEQFAKISLVTEILSRQALLSENEVRTLLAVRQRYPGAASTAVERAGTAPAMGGKGELPDRAWVSREELQTIVEEVVRRLKSPKRTRPESAG